jgi:hypothetical protein
LYYFFVFFFVLAQLPFTVCRSFWFSCSQITQRFVSDDAGHNRGLICVTAYLDPRTKSLANLPAQWADAVAATTGALIGHAAALGVADNNADGFEEVLDAGLANDAAQPAPNPANVLLGTKKRDASSAPTSSAKRAATLEQQEWLLASVGQKRVTRHTTLADEMTAYNVVNEISWTDDPLEWWRDNEKTYPRLARLARALLCIQATSCESERVFSKAGIILDGRRSLLAPKNVDKMLFLHDNWALCE